MHCFFPKHTIWSVIMWQNTQEHVVKFVSPMGSRGSCTKVYQFIGWPYCVTSWVSFFTIQNFPVGFGEKLQGLYCQRILYVYIYPSFQCKEANWTLSIWESHDVSKCWVGSYHCCWVGFYVLGGYQHCWVRKNLWLWF